MGIFMSIIFLITWRIGFVEIYNMSELTLKEIENTKES